MKDLKLLFKLALLPLFRSWFLLGLMIISFAQVMLALWFCGSIQKELRETKRYASIARMITVQMKDPSASLEPVKEALQGDEVTFEELKTDDVLKKMEEEEPELIQTVRALGAEGMQLVPKIMMVRGVVSDEAFEKVKLMTDVYRIDQSPVHHARLQKFYSHMGFEMRICILLILFLVTVQLLVFQRIQNRDSLEVMKNLLAWGVSGLQARVPGFLSIVSLSLFSLLISVIEWFSFRKWVWKNNAFLGELSIDHSLAFPVLLVMVTLVGVILLSLVLSFSGRTREE